MFSQGAVRRLDAGDSAGDNPLPQVFGRLGPQNPLQWEHSSNEALVEIFKELIDGMHTTETARGPAPAGMTFLGQFIDHDITFDASSEIGRVEDPGQIRNVRTPNLDLDCVYGAGPEASPHLYGKIDGREGYLLFGNFGYDLDLARNCQGIALIGDPRNDENIFVSQVQGLFICAHNLLLNELHSEPDSALSEEIRRVARQGIPADVWKHREGDALLDFVFVRRFMRLHYQRIVMKDFLPNFVDQKIIDECCAADRFGVNAAVMPVEFSGAAYRFGHATVQENYELREGESLSIFGQTGQKFRGAEHNLDMALFFGDKAQRARPIGTEVANSLFALPFIAHGFHLSDGTKVDEELAAILPLRNIIRDRFTLQIAAGQQMANQLGLTPLPVPKILADAEITKTPLWFYILQEAEGAGGKLTGVGGRIVASVMARLLKLDPISVEHIEDFKPHASFATMLDMANFVSEKLPAFKERKALYCGTPKPKEA
jgi:hypothetical protein